MDENDSNSVNAWKGTADLNLRVDTTIKDATSQKNVTTKNKQISSTSSSATAAKTKVRPINNDINVDDDEMDYVPKWARSSKTTKSSSSSNDDDDTYSQHVEQDEQSQFHPTDELPPFADEESIALHKEIKLLEQRRDEAASTTRSNKERVDIINDHLRSIRQEIDHTNSLVAAKKSEVDTEEHLLSLSKRELGQSLRDTSVLRVEMPLSKRISRMHKVKSRLQRLN